VRGSTLHLAPVGTNATTTSLSEIGTPSVPPPPILYGVLIAPRFILFGSNTPAVGFLIGRVFSPGELPFLINTIFSSEDWGDVIRRIRSGNDAQAFIDLIDEARPASAHHY